MKISFLYNKIPWFGKYSGYEYMVNLFNPNEINLCNASKNNFIKRVIGKILQLKFKIYSQTTFGLLTGYSFLKLKTDDLKHILYLENHLYLLGLANSLNLNKLITTIHLPLGQWKEENLTKLKDLKHVIFLYENEIAQFKPYLPKAQINFIHHGVNNDYFKPNHELKNYNQLLCVGHYLRDFDLLADIYKALKLKNQFIELHLIIPKAYRDEVGLKLLSDMKDVYFHENLSDDELLNFYQSSSLLLMPMIDSGANTAIVQAIACGLPIVTTAVGGISSYGGGDIYPIFKSHKKKELINYAEVLIHNMDENLKVSASLRKFSIETLDWNKVKEKHLNIYKKVISS